MFSRIEEVECTVVDITTTKAPITLGSFYIHPSASGDSITTRCRNRVTLYGDFNAKGAFNGQGEHSNTIGKAIDRFLDSCMSCQLVFPDNVPVVNFSDSQLVHSISYGGGGINGGNP
jgi:hypothetical protein